MAKFRVCLLFLVFFCAVSFPGCSNNGAITITLSPSTTATLNAGQTQSITATLTNDKNNEGVTWSVSGFGSLNNPTSTSVTYVAPNGISVENSATVTATSVASSTVTASLSITVNPVLAVSTTSLPVGTVGVPYVGVIGAVGATGTFTWTLTSGNLPAGLALSTSTSGSITILGTPTTVETSAFTIEVTDASGVSVSRELSITINPPPPLSVATRSLPIGTVGAVYSATLQAASGVAPYSWTLTGGTLPPGNPAFTLSSGGIISGTPTTAGTSMFTVEVKDSSSPNPQTATANLSITINPSSSGNVRLNGNYAFLVSGFSGSSNFAAAGSFVADGSGNITGGLIDTNSNGAAGVQVRQPFTGTYLIGTNGVGTLVFNITGGGTRTFVVTLTASNNAQMIEFDDTTGTGTRDSGVLLKQTTSAFSSSAIQGNYVFGFLGADASANRYGFAGQFHADGNGHFNSGILDSDDAVSGAASSVAFTGTYTTPNSSNGRGTATISIAGQGTTNYSFYVVSATQLLVMEIDSLAGSPLVSGSMLQQSGTFTTSSLNGISVLETTALTSNQTQAQLGLLTTGGGTLSFSADENTGGTLTSPSASGGSYVVASTGRVALSGSGIASSDPVLYLVSTNQAFIVGTDSAVTFGFMGSQSGTPFANTSLSGSYAGGSIAPVQSIASDQVDLADADGAGDLTLTTYASTSSGLIQNQSTSASYNLTSNGRSLIMESGAQTGVIYMVSSAEFFELYTAPATNQAVMVEHFQQ